MPRKTFLRIGKHRGDRERYRQNCSLLGNFSHHAVVKRKQASQFRDFFFFQAQQNFTISLAFVSFVPFMRKAYLEALFFSWAFLMAQRLKRLTATQETWVRSLCWEDPLEKEMATHSSTLAWRIPWTEEPGGLQSTGSQRVGHDWATSLTHSFLNCENSWISLENVEDLLK